MNKKNLSDWIKDEYGYYKQYTYNITSSVFVGTMYSDIFQKYEYYFQDNLKCNEIFPSIGYSSHEEAMGAADLAIEKYFKLHVFL